MLEKVVQKESHSCAKAKHNQQNDAPPRFIGRRIAARKDSQNGAKPSRYLNISECAALLPTAMPANTVKIAIATAIQALLSRISTLS
jgi:hypothetical protein